ncbi:MAG: hypothetical protein ACI4F6_07010 [Acutalibacteraceae bacterium]
MKFHKKLATLLLSLVALASVTTTTVFADPGDTAADDPQTSVDTPSVEQPGDSTGDNQPEEPAEPAPPAQDTPSTGSNEPDTNNGNTNNGNTNNGYNNYDSQPSYGNDTYYDSYSRSPSVVDRDNEYYQPGTMGEDSTQPVVDNKLYTASLSGDSTEMNADDWNIALDLDETGGGSDFNFIKNNDSTDDSVLYQLMLFGGVLLITISIFGVILVIVMTIRTSKRNKALIAKASRAQAVDISSFEISKPAKPEAKSDNSKYDTDGIDLSKYDKYL